MVITLLILIAISSLFQLYVTKYENKDKEKKIIFINIAVIIIGIIIAILVALKDIKSDNQHDRIERFDSLNHQLSIKIDSLSKINNSISLSSRQIAYDNKVLAQKNANISDSIRFIVRQTQNLSRNSLETSKEIKKIANKEYTENTTRGSFNFKFDKPINSMQDVIFDIGSNTLSGSPHIFLFNNIEPVTFKILNHKLFLSGQIIDFDHNHLVEILDNDWLVSSAIRNKLNYDNKGFEVIDNQNNVIFSLDILPNNTVKIQGVIYGNNAALILGAKGLPMTRKITTANDTSITKLFKKLFIYTGTDYLGKRIPK